MDYQAVRKCLEGEQLELWYDFENRHHDYILVVDYINKIDRYHAQPKTTEIQNSLTAYKKTLKDDGESYAAKVLFRNVTEEDFARRGLELQLLIDTCAILSLPMIRFHTIRKPYDKYDLVRIYLVKLKDHIRVVDRSPRDKQLALHVVNKLIEDLDRSNHLKDVVLKFYHTYSDYPSRIVIEGGPMNFTRRNLIQKWAFQMTGVPEMDICLNELNVLIAEKRTKVSDIEDDSELRLGIVTPERVRNRLLSVSKKLPFQQRMIDLLNRMDAIIEGNSLFPLPRIRHLYYPDDSM